MQLTLQPRMRLAGALLALSLSACGSVHSTYVPDGRRGFVVTCGGFLNGWSACLVKAGHACGNQGYEVIKGNEEDRAMMIACKLPNYSAAPKSGAN